jgi:hypothetical protein
MKISYNKKQFELQWEIWRGYLQKRDYPIDQRREVFRCELVAIHHRLLLPWLANANRQIESQYIRKAATGCMVKRSLPSILPED